MDSNDIMKIFDETAYVRIGGSDEELRCAEYIKDYCARFGAQAVIEPFPVDMATMKHASLIVDGTEIPCTGYLCAGSGEVEAPFFYLQNTDAFSLSQCKGKIVLIDGYLGYWLYQDLLENGAVGFITHHGNANFVDEEIDVRELRSYVCKGNKLFGVNVNTKTAISLVKSGAKTAKIVLDQEEYTGESRNVILDLPGETEETIVFTAHYDSVSLSQGVYDNMSGSVGLLALAEAFSKKPHRHSLRFIWCGSEERGLLGSKAYVNMHEDILSKVVLVINLDMIGSIMGKFIACCTSEESLCTYISYLAAEVGFGIKTNQDVYSSDSTPFADKGIPAVSFARLAPPNTATIHNSYDTVAIMSGEQMVRDIAFIETFATRMANAAKCPVAREMPDNMKEKLDNYLGRKRKK